MSGAGVEERTASVFEQLGTRPIINARGIYTDLGGSRLSPEIWAAMSDMNRYFVDMVDLLDSTGRIIAGLMGAEAARVVPGASAAITLGTAACMTGTDGRRMEQLPTTDGMKNEVLIQRGHRYKYDRCVRMAGAALIEVGDDGGTTREQLEQAIGPMTAALCFPAHLDGTPGTVGLRDTLEIAHQQDVPVLVDAAYLNFPPKLMSSFAAAGCDLVCFSAKYFGGPNAGGFIYGRKDLIAAVAGVDFTGFESGQYRTFGRPFKLDRQIVAAVVLALQSWLTMDHTRRFDTYRRQVDALRRALADLDFLELTPMSFTMAETLEPEPVNCLHIRFGENSPKTPHEVEEELRAGNPVIAVHAYDDSLVVDMEMVAEGDELIIAQRLREALTSERRSSA